MTISVKKLVQQSPLDVNLWVDRTAKPLEDYELIIDPVIELVPLAHQIHIPIVNFDDLLTYSVSVDHGSVNINTSSGIISYTAPIDFPPNENIETFKINLTIDVHSEVIRYTYLPDDTLIDEIGLIHKVPEIWETLSLRMQDEIIEQRKTYAGYDSTNVVNGANFKIENTFPSGFMQQSWKDDPEISGGLDDYELPYDIDTTPSDSPFFHNVETEIIDGKKVRKAIYRPRNSNIDEAQGDVLNGYRYPGAVGSSLTVIQNEDETDKRFVFTIPVGLDSTFPIIPDEILTLCIKDINVIPIFRGNVSGHVFEWEQISGDTSSIVWTVDPLTYELTIAIGAISADRVFRLWVSKGTIYEYYVDMILYATPRSLISGFQSNENQFVLGAGNLKIDKHETHPIVLTGERIWGKKMRVNILRKIR